MAEPDRAGRAYPDDPQERFAGVVHDLRTPLAVIAGFAGLLRRRGDALSDAEREDYVQRIAEAAEEMRAILESERAQRM